MQGVDKVEEANCLILLHWEEHDVVDGQELHPGKPVVLRHRRRRELPQPYGGDEVLHSGEHGSVPLVYGVVDQSGGDERLPRSAGSHQKYVVYLVKPHQLPELSHLGLGYARWVVEVERIQIAVLWQLGQSAAARFLVFLPVGQLFCKQCDEEVHVRGLVHLRLVYHGAAFL